MEKGEKRGTAALCIHGILGTPRQFDGLKARWETRLDVIAPWLPGHGGDARAFAQSGMDAWEKAARHEVEKACAAYENVYLVGHSMGGLLLAPLADGAPAVRGLLLIAMPLRFHFRPHAMMNSLRVAFTRRPCPAREACGIAPRPLWACLLWTPRYLELFREARRVRACLKTLKTPARCVYFAKDELCAPSSARLLPPHIPAVMLPLSRHAEWTAEETDAIARALPGLSEADACALTE